MKNYKAFDLLYYVVIVIVVLFFADAIIKERRTMQDKKEIHKLNIEKVKLEIEILKKHK